MRVSSVSQNIFENVNQNRNKKTVVPAIDTEEKQQTGTQNTVENISKVSVYNTNSDLIKTKMISQGEEAQKQTDLSCYYQLAEMFPELSFHFTDGVDENGNPKLYGTGYFCKGQADSDQNSGCVINVDKKVIDSMQENRTYADRVKSILSNAKKVTNGFITNCEEHAKELSTDGYTCTVGKVVTRLVDDGGKPALVTSVQFEYTYQGTEEERTVDLKWYGTMEELEEKLLEQIKGSMEQRIQELLKDRE